MPIGLLVNVTSYNNYYVGGMLMPGRTYTSSDGYDWGYSGKLKDDEINGAGNIIDFGDREFDSRLMRWWRVDPFVKSYPSISPYAYALNNAIMFVDKDGDIIYDSKGNKVEIIFNTETGEIAEIRGTDDERLKELIMNTYKDSPEGESAIKFLNADNVKYKVSVHAKRAVWQSPHGGYGSVDGLSGESVEDYNAEIDIFGYDVEKIEDVNNENFEKDFEVRNKYGQLIPNVNEKTKQKIIKSVNNQEGESKHKEHQESLGNLTEEEKKNYDEAAEEDATNRKQRGVNTLIYETANSRNQWGTSGETAGKQAVGNAFKQRKQKTK